MATTSEVDYMDTWLGRGRVVRNWVTGQVERVEWATRSTYDGWDGSWLLHVVCSDGLYMSWRLLEVDLED